MEHTLFMSLMGMETRELVIADVGTGSGAIAVNLAIHLPAARIYALDNADAVLDVASYNIRAHNVADRVTLCKGDLLEPLPEPADLIVANLPYIPSERIPTLQPEIQWEPREALDGGLDGLDLIRRLLTQAHRENSRSMASSCWSWTRSRCRRWRRWPNDSSPKPPPA